MQDSGDRKDKERRAADKQVTGPWTALPGSSSRKEEGKKSQWRGGGQVEWKERQRALTLSVLNAVHSTNLSPAACSKQPPNPQETKALAQRASGQHVACPVCLIAHPPLLDPDTNKDKNQTLRIWRGRQHVGAGVWRTDTN